VQNGQWDRMTKWLGTLTTGSMDGVDLVGVKDIGDWVSRLWAAGHLVDTTRGTSGKVSFLNRTQGDDDLLQRLCWQDPIRPMWRSSMEGQTRVIIFPTSRSVSPR